jgi:hypothetical protein
VFGASLGTTNELVDPAVVHPLSYCVPAPEFTTVTGNVLVDEELSPILFAVSSILNVSVLIDLWTRFFLECVRLNRAPILELVILLYLFKLRGNVDMFAVKSKFKVGAATSVVATSTVLGASVVVLEDADGTAVEPAIPTVPPCAVNLIATIPEPPRPPLIVVGLP